MHIPIGASGKSLRISCKEMDVFSQKDWGRLFSEKFQVEFFVGQYITLMIFGGQ